MACHAPSEVQVDDDWVTSGVKVPVPTSQTLLPHVAFRITAKPSNKPDNEQGAAAISPSASQGGRREKGTRVEFPASFSPPSRRGSRHYSTICGAQVCHAAAGDPDTLCIEEQVVLGLGDPPQLLSLLIAVASAVDTHDE